MQIYQMILLLLSEFSFHNKFADLAGFIAFDDKDEEIFTFGKYKGQKVKDVFTKDVGYFGWIQNAEFPALYQESFN